MSAVSLICIERWRVQGRSAVLGYLFASASPQFKRRNVMLVWSFARFASLTLNADDQKRLTCPTPPPCGQASTQ
jgi:hypothetical protein